MSSRSVLVTGGRGFLGRQTIGGLLDRGFKVHLVSSGKPGGAGHALDNETQSRVVEHAVDLHDHDDVSRLVERVRASHLLHLAWDTRHGLFWTSPENPRWVASSVHLVQRFCESGGTRVVGAGSCAEYSWDSVDGLLRENLSAELPSTMYGRAKLECRDRLAELCAARSVSFAWGRVFFLFGPFEGAQRLVASAIAALSRGEEFKASLGEQLRDYASTVDVAEGFVALLDSYVSGTVNVASGEARSVRSLLLTLGGLLGRSELLRFGARPQSDGEPARLVASVERLRSEVGYSPTVSIEERLRETVGWWREQR